jgi:hypothetical protein
MTNSAKESFFLKVTLPLFRIQGAEAVNDVDAAIEQRN